jgi:hypothetical protein
VYKKWIGDVALDDDRILFDHFFLVFCVHFLLLRNLGKAEWRPENCQFYLFGMVDNTGPDAAKAVWQFDNVDLAVVLSLHPGID